MRVCGVRWHCLPFARLLVRAAAQYGAGTATYDQCKSFFISNIGLPDKPTTHMLCSAVSGFATACAGTPGDVIKTRMIADLTEAQAKGIPGQYKNTWDCIVKTVRTERFKGLYKGFVPTWMRLAPWQMVFFVCFEQASLLVTGHTFPTK